ncbi:MAG: FKBP-type peptidyl-prolyl cis-trans isomerase [Verrucomicrobiaceae bacterium]|nr:FKBP-type peptidyl-prolyl cis-trans isomerase [Verrucomicrobiaceae bacterium]
MQVENGSVVSFHYTLRDTEGNTIEENRGEEPAVYLHGANNIVASLEQAFVGKKTGDHIELTLTPEQTYGARKENAIERVPAKYLKGAGKLKPGQAVQLQTKDGPMLVTVIKVGKFSVDVDTNHPLAGRTLQYAIDIADVRAASDEEKAHGHAHGVGGHHH